jgi:predicted short-subunit dehydrogenase-like oxidoreductase (DUF2520 family)
MPAIDIVMAHQPTLNIIGAGHVGRVFGRVWSGAGCFAVQDVLTRTLASAQGAVAFIGSGSAVAGMAELRRADVTLLAVGDDQIVFVCAQLAAICDLSGSVVFHCSGALSSVELVDASDAGAFVASVHPIRSFADPQAVAQTFDGTFCGVEGDAGALAILAPALQACGARPVVIDAGAKTVYHAAAVFASNYLVTLVDAALRAYQAAGIPEPVARELAQPLAMETLANAFRLGPAAALSGPIARGDMATVTRQHSAVERWDGATGQLYQALIAPTLDLARRKRGKS